MTGSGPEALWEEWSVRARELRRHEAQGQAAAIEICLADLMEWWRCRQTKPLTLDEASEESGYSYSALQKYVADGRIPNAGTKGSPRIARSDLPRKVGQENPDSVMKQIDELVMEERQNSDFEKAS